MFNIKEYLTKGKRRYKIKSREFDTSLSLYYLYIIFILSLYYLYIIFILSLYYLYIIFILSLYYLYIILCKDKKIKNIHKTLTFLLEIFRFFFILFLAIRYFNSHRVIWYRYKTAHPLSFGSGNISYLTLYFFYLEV
jgi:hypothetical protein